MLDNKTRLMFGATVKRQKRLPMTNLNGTEKCLRHQSQNNGWSLVNPKARLTSSNCFHSKANRFFLSYFS